MKRKTHEFSSIDEYVKACKGELRGWELVAKFVTSDSDWKIIYSVILKNGSDYYEGDYIELSDALDETLDMYLIPKPVVEQVYKKVKTTYYYEWDEEL